MKASSVLCWYPVVNANFDKTFPIQPPGIDQLTDLLVDDVLLQIFGYLAEKDLVHCEAVCRRWLKLIQSFVWNKLQRVQVKHSPLWERYWKRIEMDQHLRHLEGWEKYKKVSREIKSLYKNWWSGNFILNLYPFDCSQYGILFYMDENYLVTLHRKFRLYIFCRQSFKLKHEIISLGNELTGFKVKNGILMCGTITGTIKVYNLITGMQINEFAEPHRWPVKDVCFGYQDLAVAISKNIADACCHLTFWRMSSSFETRYLNHLPIPGNEDCAYELGMDENFVTVFEHGSNSRRIFIVSLETRTLVENLTIPFIGHILYEQGLLIIKYPTFIRVGPLSHGTQGPIQFFLDLAPEFCKDLDTTFCTNSKYLAVLSGVPGESATVTLYDLQAIKRKKTHSKFTFLYKVPFDNFRIQMDETQLIGIGDRDTGECSQIVVFDFAPNPPFCVHDGNELTGELSSVNRKSEGFHILLPNQAATRGYPFVIFISKELTNFESTKYLNSFKWPLAISMLAVFIFVGAQFMKYQNK